MKKTVALLLCVVLLAMLVAPTAALAKRGTGKGTPPGQAKKAGAQAEETSGTVTPGPGKNGKGNAKGLAKQGSGEGSGTVEPSEDGSGTAGVENALSRIQANIAKAEAKVAAGTKKQVPPGLLRVLEKFMSWLGLGGDDAEVPGDDGSVEPTTTPEPSDEDTSTLYPGEGSYDTSIPPAPGE